MTKAREASRYTEPRALNHRHWVHAAARFDEMKIKDSVGLRLLKEYFLVNLGSWEAEEV